MACGELSMFLCCQCRVLGNSSLFIPSLPIIVPTPHCQATNELAAFVSIGIQKAMLQVQLLPRPRTCAGVPSNSLCDLFTAMSDRIHNFRRHSVVRLRMLEDAQNVTLEPLRAVTDATMCVGASTGAGCKHHCVAVLRRNADRDLRST